MREARGSGNDRERYTVKKGKKQNGNMKRAKEKQKGKEE